VDERQRKDILAALKSFATLERKDTDEVGWIALKWSVPRVTAARWISLARYKRAIK